MIIIDAIYIACAATSLLCALLLLRGYRTARSPLLFWASICFFCFTVNNVLLFIDVIVVPQVDLFLARSLAALAGFCALLYGLIWEGR